MAAPHARIDDKCVGLDEQQCAHQHGHGPPGAQAAAAGQLAVATNEEGQQHRQLQAAGDCGAGWRDQGQEQEQEQEQ